MHRQCVYGRRNTPRIDIPRDRCVLRRQFSRRGDLAILALCSIGPSPPLPVRGQIVPGGRAPLSDRVQRAPAGARRASLMAPESREPEGEDPESNSPGPISRRPSHDVVNYVGLAIVRGRALTRTETETRTRSVVPKVFDWTNLGMESHRGSRLTDYY